MGLRIGQFSMASGTVRFPRRQERLGFRAPDARDGPGFFPEPNAGADLFAREARTPEIHAGFGENTVSIPGLSVNTIQRNVSEARRVVPDLQEQQQRVRERAAEQRALQAPRESRFEPAVFRQSRHEFAARAQARQFVTSVNDAAGAALARVQGEQPTANAGNGPAIRINGQTIGLFRQEDTPPQFSALA
jgi:hypothetical protein